MIATISCLRLSRTLPRFLFIFFLITSKDKYGFELLATSQVEGSHFYHSYLIVNKNSPFHPELEEAMSKHIHASLVKPVDDEELLYWLKSICENDSDSRDPPEA